MLLEPGGWTLVPCIDDVLAGLPPSLVGPRLGRDPRLRRGVGHAPAPDGRGRHRRARRAPARARRLARSPWPAVRRRGHAPDRRLERRRGLARPAASGDQRLDAGARASRADVRAARARRRAGPRARGARAGRAARVPPAAAGAQRQLAVLAGPRHRARLRADPDLLDVPALGHRPRVRRLPQLGRRRRRHGARRGDPRPELPVVGRPAAAALRHRRGAGHGRPDARGGHRGAGGARAVARQAARGGHPPARRSSRPRRSPRTASSRPATGSTRSSSAASAGGGRAPPSASRACWRRAARSRTPSDASRSSSPPRSWPRAQAMPGSARRAADRGLVGLVAELSAEYARAEQRARLS